MSKIVFPTAIIEDGETVTTTEFITIEGEADYIVRQMYEWYCDNGFDIECIEFELDDEMYEANSVAMHYHYAHGAMSFEDMMYTMSMIHLGETATYMLDDDGNKIKRVG